MKPLPLLLLLALALHADTIKLGVILPLSGNSAQFGQPMLQAVELFKKECATGHYRHTYQLIVEDDQLATRQTVEVMNKFLNLDRVQGIVSYSAGTGHVVAPRAAAAQLPHICIASDPKIADGKYSFIHWVRPQAQGKGAADIVQKLGGRRVAIFTQRQQGWMAVRDCLEAELKARGIQVVASELYNAGERDFRTPLAKIRELNPDVFIPLAFSPEGEILLRQAKQVGLNCRLTAAQSFIFLADKSDAEGSFFASGAFATDEFEAHSKALTGKTARVYVVANLYDALNLLRSAYEAQAKPSPTAAAEFIRTQAVASAVGGTLQMDAQGCTTPPAGYFQILKGQIVPVGLESVK